MKWDERDAKSHLLASIKNGDFMIDVQSVPAFNFFEHVRHQGEQTWSVVVGIKFDALDESWHYQLDTDYETWVGEDDIERSDPQLEIQLISRPEMTFAEMYEIVVTDFPQAGRKSTAGNPVTGQVFIQLHQQTKLTDEQRDWLHLSAFAARYIDTYELTKGE